MNDPTGWFLRSQVRAFEDAKLSVESLKGYIDSPCYEAFAPAQQEWMREQLVIEEKRLQYLTAWMFHFGVLDKAET